MLHPASLGHQLRLPFWPLQLLPLCLCACIKGWAALNNACVVPLMSSDDDDDDSMGFKPKWMTHWYAQDAVMLLPGEVFCARNSCAFPLFVHLAPSLT